MRKRVMTIALIFAMAFAITEPAFVNPNVTQVSVAKSYKTLKLFLKDMRKKFKAVKTKEQNGTGFTYKQAVKAIGKKGKQIGTSDVGYTYEWVFKYRNKKTRNIFRYFFIRVRFVGEHAVYKELDDYDRIENK